MGINQLFGPQQDSKMCVCVLACVYVCALWTFFIRKKIKINHIHLICNNSNQLTNELLYQDNKILHSLVCLI